MSENTNDAEQTKQRVSTLTHYLISPIKLDQSPDGHLSTVAFVDWALKMGYSLLFSGYQVSVYYVTLALIRKLKYAMVKWMFCLQFVLLSLGFIFL